MSKKNKKFKNIWKSQTDIGKEFGLSSVAVGKILIKEGLKDDISKFATEKALKEGFAKFTPLKDGTKYFMWNKSKIKNIISKDHKPIDKITYWTNEVKKIFKEIDKLSDEGNDKLSCLMEEVAFDDVPQDIREEVKNNIYKEND